MDCRFSDMRYKEVINICDGCRLGYVGDLELQLPEGRITALIVPGPCRFFGLFGRGGGVLRPLGVHQADRGRHHPHRQAHPASGAQAGPQKAPPAVLAGGFSKKRLCRFFESTSLRAAAGDRAERAP